MNTPHPAEAPEGVRVAFWDQDHTLIDGNSARLYVKFLRREGEVGLGWTLKIAWWMLLYKFGRLDMEGVMRRTTEDVKGQSASQMEADCNRWVAEMVAPLTFREIPGLIAAHRNRGIPNVMLTSATVYAARPMSEHLGLDDYLCNRLEIEDDRFTGRIVEPPCVQEGKIEYAERWCAEHGHTLEHAAFYTDSITDLPLLERVGHPIVINPDPLLAREAARRAWPLHRFNPVGKR